MISAMLFVAKS